MAQALDAKIDWISFTLPVSEDAVSLAHGHKLAWLAIKKLGGEYHDFFKQFGAVDTRVGRAPYRYQVSDETNSFRLLFGDHQRTALIELSGRACAGIDTDERAVAFLSGIKHRLTRIDLAIDIRTDVLPSAFANARDTGKFRSVSFIRSDTGETCYVGSPKSDRFARVYRYNPPHPRSSYMRCEHVFRKQLARDFATLLCDEGNFARVVAMVGNTWGWSHSVWKPHEQTDEKVPATSNSRQQDETLAWLYKQVAPAVARLHREGALDMTDWLERVYTLSQNE